MNCKGCGRKRPRSKFMHVLSWPIPVAARSTAWVQGRSFAKTAGSNTARGNGCLSWVVFCHVKVSAPGQSLVRRNPTECKREASIVRRFWPIRGCCAMGRGGVGYPGTCVKRPKTYEKPQFQADSPCDEIRTRDLPNTKACYQTDPDVWWQWPDHRQDQNPIFPTTSRPVLNAICDRRILTSGSSDRNWKLSSHLQQQARTRNVHTFIHSLQLHLYFNNGGNPFLAKIPNVSHVISHRIS